MKVQYCSDLHLEFQHNKLFMDQFPLKPEGEILVLAGDIVPFTLIHEFGYFFDFCSANFVSTFWLPGNHEYYGSDLSDRSNPMYINIRPNVFLLNDKTVQYKNLVFDFCTLWSHIPPHHEWTVQQSVNDFTQIKNKSEKFNVADFNALHENDLGFLKRTLALPTDKQRIVVTHHVPTLINYPEKYHNNNINCAFATELYDLIESSNAAYWIYGHHHCNTPAFVIGDTQLVTNQLGYVMRNEHNSFNASATIDI